VKPRMSRLVRFVVRTYLKVPNTSMPVLLVRYPTEYGLRDGEGVGPGVVEPEHRRPVLAAQVEVGIGCDEHVDIGAVQRQLHRSERRVADAVSQWPKRTPLCFAPLLLDGCLVEVAPGLVLKPDEELLERLRVGAARVARSNAVQDEGGDDLPSATALFSRIYVYGNAG
jgi:hypothetical protein